MPITIGSQTIGGAGGGVPTTRTIAGLDLSQDRSAAAMKTALAYTAADVSAVGWSTGLDGARPAASSGIVGAIYYATDTGYAYVCVSSTRWIRLGAGGVEGRDTTAVSASSSCVGTGTTSILSSSVVSLAFAFSVPSAPAADTVLCSILSTNGWQLDIGADSGDRYKLSMYRSGFGTASVYVGTVTASPTTPHIIAVTMSGTTTRYSLDGAAVQTASHVSGTATTSTTPFRIAGNSGGFGATHNAIGAVLWSSSVGDSDLVAVSGGYAGGRIAGVAGATEVLRWHAGWYPIGATKHPILVGNDTITWSSATTLTVR